MKYIIKMRSSHAKVFPALGFLFLVCLTQCTMNPDHFSQFPIIMTPDTGEHSNVLDLVYQYDLFYGLVSFHNISEPLPYKYSLMRTDSSTGSKMYMWYYKVDDIAVYPDRIQVQGQTGILWETTGS